MWPLIIIASICWFNAEKGTNFSSEKDFGIIFKEGVQETKYIFLDKHFIQN